MMKELEEVPVAESCHKPLCVTEVGASLNQAPYLKYLSIHSKRYARHLDLRAGNGKNVRLSKSLGLNPVGIEYDMDYCYLMKDSPIVRATADRSPFTAESFAFISLMHVLEHIPRYKDTLQDIRRMMERDGYFFIEVPNKYSLQELFNYLYGKLILSKENKHLGHCNYFSYLRLKSVLEDSGFEIIDIKATGGLISSSYTTLARNLRRAGEILLGRKSHPVEGEKNRPTKRQPTFLAAMEGIDQKINKRTQLFVEIFGFVCKVKQPGSRAQG